MKEIDIPEYLAHQIRAQGTDLHSFVVQAVEEKLSRALPVHPQTLGDKIRSGWALPTVQGKRRGDGLAWSEREAPCDPE